MDALRRLHEDHRLIERILSRALQAVEVWDGKILLESLEYASLLRTHIHKEDSVLYPLAERMLGSDLDPVVTVAFDRIEKQMDTSASDPRWLQLAEGTIYEPTVVIRPRKIPRKLRRSSSAETWPARWARTTRWSRTSTHTFVS